MKNEVKVQSGKEYCEIKDEVKGMIKGMLLLLIILYFVSPIDACPGPIDDLIVFFIGQAARKRLS